MATDDGMIEDDEYVGSIYDDGPIEKVTPKRKGKKPEATISRAEVARKLRDLADWVEGKE